jgi:RNA methyltransferase, TrmH family
MTVSTKLITSLDNPHFKFWKKLIVGGSKNLRQTQSCILSGRKLLQEALNHPNITIEAELLKEGLPSLTQNPKICYSLSPSLFSILDSLGTGENLFVIKTPPRESWCEQTPPQGIEVLCPLGDPKNLGALTRSCLAFGVTRIVLTQEACHPFLPSALKASSSSALKVTYLQGPPLHQLQGPFLALDLKGTPLKMLPAYTEGRILVGQEGLGLQGLSPETQKRIQRIQIPMSPEVESLNATVATSIVLHHFYEQTTS